MSLIVHSAPVAHLNGCQARVLFLERSRRFQVAKFFQTHYQGRVSLSMTALASSRVRFTDLENHSKRDNVNRRRRLRERVRLNSSSSESASDSREKDAGKKTSVLPSFPLNDKQIKVIFLAITTTSLAVSNRVLYKMALVPLKNYPFFLAQLTTFGYVGVYFSILYFRYKAKIVTKEMMSLPKHRFALMGFLEALGLASGMAASAILPGALISILSQTYLVWQLFFSSIILKKRYSILQLAGCLLVIFGVITVVSSGSASSVALTASFGLWPLLLVVSAAFPALSTILKEFVFRDAAARLEGGSVDIFVVNSFGSGFQALFVFLLLPLLSRLKGISFAELPSYFKSGAGCLLNIGGQVPECSGAPLVPIMYVCANLAFNISALTLLKESSGIVASLLITLAVPLTIATFTLPLPLLPNPVPLPPGFGLGLVILLGGLLMYNFGGLQQSKTREKSA